MDPGNYSQNSWMNPEFSPPPSKSAVCSGISPQNAGMNPGFRSPKISGLILGSAPQNSGIYPGISPQNSGMAPRKRRGTAGRGCKFWEFLRERGTLGGPLQALLPFLGIVGILCSAGDTEGIWSLCPPSIIPGKFGNAPGARGK